MSSSSSSSSWQYKHLNTQPHTHQHRPPKYDHQIFRLPPSDSQGSNDHATTQICHSRITESPAFFLLSCQILRRCHRNARSRLLTNPSCAGGASLQMLLEQKANRSAEQPQPWELKKRAAFSLELLTSSSSISSSSLSWSSKPPSSAKFLRLLLPSSSSSSTLAAAACLCT